MIFHSKHRQETSWTGRAQPGAGGQGASRLLTPPRDGLSVESDRGSSTAFNLYLAHKPRYFSGLSPASFEDGPNMPPHTCCSGSWALAQRARFWNYTQALLSHGVTRLDMPLKLGVCTEPVFDWPFSESRSVRRSQTEAGKIWGTTALQSVLLCRPPRLKKTTPNTNPIGYTGEPPEGPWKVRSRFGYLVPELVRRRRPCMHTHKVIIPSSTVMLHFNVGDCCDFLLLAPPICWPRSAGISRTLLSHLA